MTKRSTKQQLLLSAISLLLCVSMLVGSTFAWFTDSVTSTNNIIKSGTLDVKLEYSDDMSSWTEVGSDTNIFKEKLWEPGYTEVVYLRVSNIGTLALKYNLGINVAFEKEGKNVDGDMFKLSDYIYFDAIEDVTVAYADREAARKAAENGVAIKSGYTKAGQLKAAEGTNAAETKTIALVVYMPETVTNVANYRDVQPIINLGLNLFATQLQYEEDSFDETYDKDADFYPAWDGTTGEVPEADATTGIITINTAAELAALAAKVNAGTSYAGKTVKLGTNINLGNQPWTPIGACDSASYFQGTFDGQGYTIYGLNVDNSTDDYMYSTAGLFGWIDTGAATIKNVTISGATVKGSHWTGALVGYMSGNVIECTVEDSTIIGVHVTNDADGDKIGGLVGYVNKGELTGNKVIGCTVQGNRDVGGLVGSCVAAATEMNNNTVKDTTVVYQTEKSYASGDKIISGRTGYVPNATNVADNVTVLKGNMVAPGVVEVAPKTYEVGTKEGLQNIKSVLATVYTGEGQSAKVKLTANVDLENEPWSPIEQMWIEFDGGDHTISNLNVEGWKAGFFGYLGGGSIKNLTLENVTAKGAQAGAFAGGFEGTIDNCTLKGDNYITYAPKYQYNDPNGNLEASGGIGAITGVAQPMTVNATIEAGATVTLDYNNIVTNVAYVNELTGYIATTNGTIENNGTIKVIGAPVNYFVEAATAAELQNALDNAKATTTITLTSDITGNVMATQKDGVNVVVNGNGNKFTGVMSVFGDARHAGAETFTIKNINFVAANGADSCILSPDKETHSPSRYSYSHNVTVDNCTFIDPDGDVDCAAIRQADGGDVNWTIKNCTVESGMHSFLQVNNVKESFVIDNCKVYSKNGANLNSCTTLEMTNCNFDVTGYAVRFGVNSGGNLGEAKNFLIKDSTLKSACGGGDAVIMFRASAVDANLTLTNTALTGTTEISGNTTATTITKN